MRRSAWVLVASLALSALAQSGAPDPASAPLVLLHSPLRLADLPPVLWSEDLPAPVSSSSAGCLCTRLLDDLGRYRLITRHLDRNEPRAPSRAPDPEVEDAGLHPYGQ